MGPSTSISRGPRRAFLDPGPNEQSCMRWSTPLRIVRYSQIPIWCESDAPLSRSGVVSLSLRQELFPSLQHSFRGQLGNVPTCRRHLHLAALSVEEGKR